jgi:hypothetical protein
MRLLYGSEAEVNHSLGGPSQGVPGRRDLAIPVEQDVSVGEQGKNHQKGNQSDQLGPERSLLKGRVRSKRIRQFQFSSQQVFGLIDIFLTAIVTANPEPAI